MRISDWSSDVCASDLSVGALVGAVYVAGQLNEFAEWVGKLTMRDVFGLMDFTLTGGFVKGERLFGFFNEQHNNPDIEALEPRFARSEERRVGKGGVST